MSALEAAFKERRAQLLEEQAVQQRSKVRNVADPLISVEQIQSALSVFMGHKKSHDLWRLLAPPASMCQVSWQSPPSGPWMIKVANLAYDVFHFAPNTKLQGTKVKQALHALLLQKNLVLPQNMGSVENVLDKIDLSLRMVLNQFKETKLKPSWKAKLFRSMARDDQILLDMVLERVQLPQDASNGVLQGEAAEPEEPCLDLVPLPAPQAELALQDGSPKTSTASLPQLKRLKQFKPESVEQVMGEVPKIFDKILKGQSAFFMLPSPAPIPTSGQVGKPKATAKAGFESDEELLNAASAFAPQQTLQEQKDSKTKAKALKKKPAVKTTKATKASSQKKKPNAKAKCKAKSKSKKQQPPSEDLEVSHGQSEEKVQIPEFQIEAKPRETDTYKNKYASRQHHAAYDFAISWGKSIEDARAFAREHAAKARAIWDWYHPN